MTRTSTARAMTIPAPAKILVALNVNGHPDRKAERPATHLQDFRGVLQVDGYAGFERLTMPGDIVLAACWAHARRKFYDLHEATVHRSPPRPCGGSPNSMRSRDRSRAAPQMRVGMSVTPAPGRSSR
jgi:hypothetical protein